MKSTIKALALSLIAVLIILPPSISQAISETPAETWEFKLYWGGNEDPIVINIPSAIPKDVGSWHFFIAYFPFPMKYDLFAFQSEDKMQMRFLGDCKKGRMFTVAYGHVGVSEEQLYWIYGDKLPYSATWPEVSALMDQLLLPEEEDIQNIEPHTGAFNNI